MYLIPVPAYVIRSAIHNRKVLKVANKACHKVMGEGIKDTLLKQNIKEIKKRNPLLTDKNITRSKNL